MTLTLVSLFDGIGGFPLALSRAGVRTVATVEIDESAAAVSARHFPDAAQFSDVTEVSADDLRAAGFVPGRGIITAGWPCQDFSVAGRRAGLAGARSGLWWEVVRLLAELQPCWFVGENVPGLLSSVCTPQCEGGCMETHGGAMGAVLGSLAELGYGFAYRVLDAQHFGVPQQRKRVVIVGHLGTPWGAATQVLLEPESSAGDSPPGQPAGARIAPCLEAGANNTGGTRPPGTTVDTASSLVTAADYTHTHTTGPVSTLQGGGKRGYRIDAESAAGGHLVAFSHTAGIDPQCSEAVTPTLKAGHDTMPSVAHETIVRRLTPLECERLQGYPDEWTAYALKDSPASDSARYRELGNSIAVPVFEWLAHRLVAVDESLGAVS